MKNPQLCRWQAEFGDAYTERNLVDWQTRSEAWRTMLDHLHLRSVVEVGCNRGHNLRAIRELDLPVDRMWGIEPNAKALQMARSGGVPVLSGNIFELPFADHSISLMITSGVLIHVSLADLSAAISELYRVSQRYILAIEYYAPEESIIHYRGYDDMLWKRDFRAHFLNQYPDLKLIRSGQWLKEQGFDRAHWWMFEKQQ